ncbi:MAG: hypothetical protein KJ077_30170 [Anaerolineae bacterium]|nr:hypothetical protein [Anaerolineae bacterium]
MEASKTHPYDNPYVGPRTFTRQEGDRFFGREREARDLFSLVVSERLVLFYAQSGAGKSSLINTRLISQLQAAGFAVLPVCRVSGELPPGVADVDNVFTFNLMLNLDESESDPRRFTHIPLTDFLAGLTSDDGQHYYFFEAEADLKEANAQVEALQSVQDGAEDAIYAEVPSVLIIDQFEEIITAHSARWQEREGFFRQLNEAMAANPLLWVVLTLREDFVAALDPYAPLLSNKLRARFYMQRMGYEAALEAVEKPAEFGGRPFAPGVAESLVDNLRQVRVEGQAGTQPGQFVEPVQLQVVCYQLWEKLKERPAGQISSADLQELGNVDTALAEFYEQALQKTMAQTGISEMELRNWFSQYLITEAGTRGTVYQGTHDTAGLPNRAVKLLADQFLLRAEIRSGGTWYELVHDRFVEPILQANQAWRLKQPLIQMAQAWADAGHAETLLLDGQQLNDALASDWQGLGPLVAQFLEAGQVAYQAKEEIRRAEKETQRQRELEAARRLAEEAEARRLAEELRRQEIEARAREQAETAAKLRQRAVLLAVVGAVAVLLAIIAGIFGVNSQRSANLAGTQAAEARAAQQTAEAERGIAQGNLEYARQLEQQATQAAQLGATQTALAATADIVQAALAGPTSLPEVNGETLDVTSIPSSTVTATPVAPPLTSATPPAVSTPGPTTSLLPTTSATLTAAASPTQLPEQRVTVQALQTQAAQVEVAQTVVAQVAACPVDTQGEFVDLWRKYQEQLGCPRQASPVGGFFAEQPFEHGFMVWSQLLDLYVVLVGDAGSGSMWIIRQSEVTWPVNMSGGSCEADPPPDLFQPVRGFGGIWCAKPDIRNAIGFGTQPERGVSSDLFQGFERGAILRAGDNSTFVLFGDDQTYRRE